MSPEPATQLLICADDSERELEGELAESFPGVTFESVLPRLFRGEVRGVPGRPMPHLAFARQWLPGAHLVRAESIRTWADVLFEEIVSKLPPDQPWLLHVAPHYGAPSVHYIGARAWHSRARLQSGQAQRPQTASGPARDAGQNRCELIRSSLLERLQRNRRQLLRCLNEPSAPFLPSASLVQLLLTGPEQGFVSTAVAPLPFEQRHVLSPFVKGEVVVPPDRAAPSRAFAKLVEAEKRFGRVLKGGDTCVDLGAAPGSWTYVAVQRGVRVQAVDRSGLRADLMANSNVSFERGNAFRFAPRKPVDWLLCDVIVPPEQTAQLLLDWVRHGWCRHWIVILKWQNPSGSQSLNLLKRELPFLAADLYITRLCANKKEVCVFGSLAVAK